MEARSKRALTQLNKVRRLMGLSRKSSGPFFHSLAWSHQIAPSRHKDDLSRLQFQITPDIPKKRRAVSTRHINVAQNQVGEVLPSHFEPCDTGISLDDVITMGTESDAECGPHFLRVIDQENCFQSRNRRKTLIHIVKTSRVRIESGAWANQIGLFR